MIVVTVVVSLPRVMDPFSTYHVECDDMFLQRFHTATNFVQ
jgi:hypothetical protein